MALGSLSYLGPTLAPEHTRAHGGDMGRTEYITAEVYECRDDLYQNAYAYLWVEAENAWYWVGDANEEEWSLVTAPAFRDQVVAILSPGGDPGDLDDALILARIRAGVQAVDKLQAVEEALTEATPALNHRH